MILDWIEKREGYLSYSDGLAITAGIKALAEFFDELGNTTGAGND